jgi:ABC-type glycerol-3-phosphate transport system substrate-binding protein
MPSEPFSGAIIAKMPSYKTWLVTALLLFATGCSGLNPSLSTNTPAPILGTDSQATPTESMLDPTAASSLTLWLPPFLAPEDDNPAGLMLQQRLDAFRQQQPEVELNVRIKAAHGPGGLLETMQAASTAAPETLPDVIALDPTGLYTAALKGLVVPLSESLNQPLDEDWYPFAIEASQIDGEYYGFPFASDGIILAYRTPAFSSAPLSWQQLLDSNQTFLLPAGDPESLFTLAQYLQLDGPTTTEDGRPALDATILASILNFYRDARDEGALNGDALSYRTGEESWQALLNGTGQSALAPLASFLTNETSRQISASPLPTRDGEGMGISLAWSWAMATTNPARQQMASQLISWLSAPEFLGPWTESLGLLPPTRSALEQWSESELTPIATLLASSLQARPSEEDLATIGPAIHTAVEAVLSGALSPEAAALQASQQVQSP